MLKALDLFCGAGGVSTGLERAGFDVWGVDIHPQPNYPFDFIQADALNVCLDDFDFIWASPPCQGYSGHVSSMDSEYVPTRGMNEPLLIDPIRERLIATGKPYIIENVYGARWWLHDPIMLCGTMFNLPIARHRLFESNLTLKPPEHPKCRGVAKRFALENDWEYRDMSVTGKGRHAGTAERWKQIMGITHHMTQHEIVESIPPPYAEYLGNQVREWIER